MSGFIEKGKDIYTRADQLTGGRLGIVARSYARFLEMRGLEASAALAYYALFSLFPLMLLMIAILSIFLASGDLAYSQTLAFIQGALPVSQSLIADILLQILNNGGPVGVIGLVGLLWAASSYFNVLAYNVNIAWPSVKLRNLMQNRLMALAMIGAIFILLLLSLITSTIANLLPILINIIVGDNGFLESQAWFAILRIVPAAFTFLMFTALYRLVPNKTVQWNAVWIGSLITTIAWETAKSLFGLYMRLTVVSYEVVYGSLGTLAALMLWIYFSNFITLFGAHLVAVLDLLTEQAIKEQETAVPVDAQAEVPPIKGFVADDPQMLKSKTAAE